MKIQRFFVAIYTLLSITVTIRADFFILVGPGASQKTIGYWYQQQRDVVCATTEVNSSLVWNVNVAWKDPAMTSTIRKRPESYIITANGDNQPVSTFNCDFIADQHNQQKCNIALKNWDKSDEWSINSSVEKPMAPVFDSRWEDFYEFKLEDHRYELINSFPTVGAVPVSVRGPSNAHFLLCDGPRHTVSCFWIIIGGWENKMSVIRKCLNGVPNPPQIPSGECAVKQTVYLGQPLSTTEWRTFVLSWNFANGTNITVYDSLTQILSYAEGPEKATLNRNIEKKSLLARLAEPSLIRFHIYNYLSTTKTRSKLTSPDINVDNSRQFCVQMMLGLCDSCVMVIDLIDSNNKLRALATIVGSASTVAHGLPTWQSVKLKVALSKEMTNRVKLKMLTLQRSPISANPLWAIASFEKCPEEALKVTKVETLQDNDGENYFWPATTCQKMSGDGFSKIIAASGFNISDNPQIKDFRPMCPEGKIGSSCLASCSTFFAGNKNCKGLVSCDEKGCYCPQGFSGPACDNECSNQMYGFGCAESCGHCESNDCNHITGECRRGCEVSTAKVYEPPFCKKGIATPTLPSYDIINSTSVRVHLNVLPDYTIIKTRVIFVLKEFKAANESSTVIGDVLVKKNTIILEGFANNLLPGTRYLTAAILEVGNKSVQLHGDWQSFVTPCIELMALNFRVEPGETNLTLNYNTDIRTNDLCQPSWYHAVLEDVKKNLTIYDDSLTTLPSTFENLTYFTVYKLTISSQEHDGFFSKVISTLEGSPSPVTNLGNTSFSSHELQIAWNVPDQQNGNIVNYQIFLDILEFGGCRDLNLTSVCEKAKPGCSSTISLKATSLAMKHVVKELQPYTKYSVKVTAFTSRRAGMEAKINYTTDSAEVPADAFSNIRVVHSDTSKVKWDPPKDCKSISGPIKGAKVNIEGVSKPVNTFKTSVITSNYSILLNFTEFIGAETYLIRVFAMRDLQNVQSMSNKSLELNVHMPPRAPPPVRDLEIIEVNIRYNTTTLRWQKPADPINGVLSYYSVGFCSNVSPESCRMSITQVSANRTCAIWKDHVCATIEQPADPHDDIEVKAYNKDVVHSGASRSVPDDRTEKVPNSPQHFSVNVEDPERARVKLVWSHPWRTGGALDHFLIEAEMKSHKLKNTKAIGHKITDKYWIGPSGYLPQYIAMINLLPSSVFRISVSAVTVGRVKGYARTSTIETPMAVILGSRDLQPRVEENDSTIYIRIPEVLNDIKGSIMQIFVKGPRHCDFQDTNDINKKHTSDINKRESGDGDNVWQAASLIDLEKYANREFPIGDGKFYGGVKNVALCPEESYTIDLVVVDESRNKIDRIQGMADGYPKRVVLAVAKTRLIRTGSLPASFSTWFLPLLLACIIILVIIAFLYRKRWFEGVISNTQTGHQGNEMPLSNNFSEKKKISANEDCPYNDISPKETRNGTSITINNGFICADTMQKLSLPISVTAFEDYFRRSVATDALVEEYNAIARGPTKPWSYGLRPEIKSKNRYANLSPYDDTRVILDKHPNDPYSDYINANYITGYDGVKKTYIATQGPKPNTIIDFWRMIYQEKVRVICMMANVVENGKTKCETYWPVHVGKKIKYGNIFVQNTGETIYSNFISRSFQVSRDEQKSYTVQHLHYTSWPDHGVPSDVNSIVSFLTIMHVSAPMNHRTSPIVVHCSAGIGRTGTIILVDLCLCRATTEGVIDVRAGLLSIRADRVNMVDNEQQYLLVHLILVEYLFSSPTSLQCHGNSFIKIIESAKADIPWQYQRMLDMAWRDRIVGPGCIPSRPLSEKNRAKHRFPDMATTASANRVYLRRHPPSDEDSDYIAAIFVDGIASGRCKCVAAELPMPTTLNDFWRMIAELDVNLIVTLQSPDLQNSTFCELIPGNKTFEPTPYLQIAVIPKSATTECSQQYYTELKLRLIDTSEKPTRKRPVTILSCPEWRQNTPPPPVYLIHLFNAVQKFQTIGNPIVTLCHDGVYANGLWLAASFILNQMRLDHELNVSLAVRSVRKFKENFLAEASQMEYLYDLAAVYYEEWLKTEM